MRNPDTRGVTRPTVHISSAWSWAAWCKMQRMRNERGAEQGSDWLAVEALFDLAWEIAPAQRLDWLRGQPVPAHVLAEVLQWLEAADESLGFLESDTVGEICGRAELPFERIGCWRVCSLLGQGGMGSVHVVERDDGQFTQRAALKLIDAADADSAARFHRERQVLAALEHPGIARIVDGGDAPDGRPFLVMEYVAGVPIDRYCEAHAAGMRARIALMLQACEALAHAHARRVVHRDVTPANLLVDPDQRVRLIDFGIAEMGGAQAGEVALSWDYAAPELARGGTISTAVDVFGVGAVLYRLVSGRPPRSLAGASALVAASGLQARIAPIRETIRRQPDAGRWVDESLLGDIDAILQRALDPEPACRYESVNALRADLVRALDGDVVEARSHDRRHRLLRGLHRARWRVAAVAAIVLSLVTGTAVAVAHAREAARQRDEALREQARMEAVQQAVFHMFRSVGETRGSEAKAAEALDVAARRIEHEFVTDPARGGPILHALGELYFLLTDYEAAAPLLRRLADADPADVDPALIARGRHDLAQVLHRQGHAEEAAERLAQAQQFWRGDSIRWQSRLLDSRLLESQLLRQRGELGPAVAVLEAALPLRIEASGATHRETGVLHNNLAVAHFDAGDLEAARAQFGHARAVWRAAGLEQSPDALNTLNNAAAAELASGRPHEAESLFTAALELRNALYGESAATAALISNLGKLKLSLGEAAVASDLLGRAAQMAERYAGAGSLHHVAALAGLSEAFLALGDTQAAETTALAAQSSLPSGGREAGPAAAMAMLALGRVRVSQGDEREARRVLDSLRRLVGGLHGAIALRLGEQASRLTEQLEARQLRPAPGGAMPVP